jgi:hypothetical protein
VIKFGAEAELTFLLDKNDQKNSSGEIASRY